MFVFAGTSWIHGNRDSTISTTVSFLRYLYPAAFFISSILLIHTMKMLIFQKKHGLKYLFLLVFSMMIFMLIGQRGVMIILIASFIILSYRLSKLNITQLFVCCILIFLFGVLARTIIEGSLSLESVFLIPLNFLYGGDGTQVDSLAFAVSYVQQNGIRSTIFYEFLTVLNHRFRIDAGMMTASDILNTASLGEYYYILGYGYNFNNTSILVLNYSYFMPILYVALIMSYRALMKSLRSISPKADNIFIYYIIMQFFISSVGSFHWLLYACALVLLIKLITLIMLKSFCIAK
jgi:hypothetical protein